MGDMRCSQCGGPCGNQGHMWKLPPEFWCEKGQENERLIAAGKPEKWKYGVLTKDYVIVQRDSGER